MANEQWIGICQKADEGVLFYNTELEKYYWTSGHQPGDGDFDPTPVTVSEAKDIYAEYGGSGWNWDNPGSATGENTPTTNTGEYVDGPVVKGMATWWADDAELYMYTKRGEFLSFEEFKDRYAGLGISDEAMRDQYNKYAKSFDVKQENMKLGSQQDMLSMAESYMKMMPGYGAYSQYIPWYLQHVKDLQEEELGQYPGQLTVGRPEEQEQIMDLLGQQLSGGDIEKAYKEIEEAYRGAYEDYQPALKKAWEENALAPAKEQLQALGLSGASPGIEMMAGLGEDYAIEEAALLRDSKLGLAQAMANTESAKLSALTGTSGLMMDILGRDEARQRANIGTSYQDWLTRQNYQREAAGLGGSVLGTSAGALSSAMGQGLTGAGTLYQGQLSTDQMLAQQGFDWDVMKAEQKFMAPFLEMANQPIPVGGGKK